MDPNATWQRILAAIEADDLEGAADAAEDLLHWVRGGGFVPEHLREIFGKPEAFAFFLRYFMNGLHEFM